MVPCSPSIRSNRMRIAVRVAVWYSGGPNTIRILGPWVRSSGPRSVRRRLPPFALRGDSRHRHLAMRILTELAGRYESWPNRDNVLGPSRPFFSTYLESIWLLSLCHAIALLEQAPHDDADRRAFGVVREHPGGAQCRTDCRFPRRSFQSTGVERRRMSLGGTRARQRARHDAAPRDAGRTHGPPRHRPACRRHVVRRRELSLVRASRPLVRRGTPACAGSRARTGTS